MQYSTCSDLISTTHVIEPPTRAEIDDSSLTEDEKELVFNTAVAAFNDEKSGQFRECAAILPRFEGDRWFQNFKESKGINCQNLGSWPFSRLEDYLMGRPAAFIEGAREAHKQMKQQCGVSEGYICDEREGQSCGPWSFQAGSPATLCFAPDAIKNRLNFESGSCIYSVFTKGILNAYYFVTFKEIPVSTAKLVPSCLTFSSDQTQSSSFKTKINCKP
jgi:hypothetical protein